VREGRRPKDYKRLGVRGYRPGADGAWLHVSHLLLVRTRWLREQYTRLYWHDIQAIALYGVPGLSGLARILETTCLMAYMVYAFGFGNRLSMACAAIFSAAYGIARWRTDRFGYAVYTRVNVTYFPAGASRAKSERGLATLENAVRNLQETSAISETAVQTVGPATARKAQSITWVHALLFTVVLLIYPAAVALKNLKGPEQFGVGIGAVFIVLPLLITTLVLQKDLDFPASVKVFAWFYQIGFLVELLQALSATWIPFRWNYGSADRAAHAVRTLLPALCGLLMIYLERVKRQDQAQTSSISLDLH
jgi:hypothetical protein